MYMYVASNYLTLGFSKCTSCCHANMQILLTFTKWVVFVLFCFVVFLKRELTSASLAFVQSLLGVCCCVSAVYIRAGECLYIIHC